MESAIIDTLTHLKRGSPFSETDAFADILTLIDENGEFPSTIRQLMSRWGWSNKKTFNFLSKLEKGNILETQRKHKGNTLYRINTAFASLDGNTKETQRKHKGNAKKDEDAETYKRIIDYINTACGTNYRHTTDENTKDIKARLKEGYSEEDFYTVIDKKTMEWKGTKHERYLRPTTLFGDKFESYMNQNIIEGSKKNKFNDFPQREYDYKMLEKSLLNTKGKNTDGGD